MEQTCFQIMAINYQIQPFLSILPFRMRKVCYVYNEDITKYEFSKEHPMKPKRIKMVHSLINNYDLSTSLKMFHSKEATSEEMGSFHHPNYIKYLETWISPKAENIVQQYSLVEEQSRWRIKEDQRLASIFKINQGFDCPGFEGLYDFCKLAAGSSIDAADLIIAGQGDLVINWAGGFHHGKKTEASGFCYINDIVICILELLKVYPRVLYLDIDVHHGDGVEEAFYYTNRVMTVSFHQFGEQFFPGTGSLAAVGEGLGKYYTVNVPLRRGMDDISYINLFKKVMEQVMTNFCPDVVVIQCGADSLSKDKLGHMNLSVHGHGECVEFMKSFATPLILLGGGGYTIENVARCWTYETGLMLGRQIQNEIPKQDKFYHYYGKEGNKVHFPVDKIENTNSPQYLNNIYMTICENLRQSQMRPSVGFHSVPSPYLPTKEKNMEVIDVDDHSMIDQSSEQYVGINNWNRNLQ